MSAIDEYIQHMTQHAPGHATLTQNAYAELAALNAAVSERDSALKSINDDLLKLLQAIIINSGGTVTIPLNVIAAMPKDAAIERVDGETAITYRIATQKGETVKP